MSVTGRLHGNSEPIQNDRTVTGPLASHRPINLLTPDLEAETERLLAKRTREIRFSADMQRAYRGKTWPQRSKIARSCMVWVAALAMMFVPISHLLAPGELWLVAPISGGLVPALHALAYLVWCKPRSAATEGLSLILLMTSIMIAFGALAVAAGGSNYERFLTGILYVNAVAIVVFNVDFIWALVLLSCATTLFFGFQLFNPAIGLDEAIGVTLFYASGIYAAAIARRTQIILSQKTFLMSLRDQYRSRQLEILATRDPLTGLPNRRSAAEHVNGLWTDRRVPLASIALLMADIDFFKRLNDSAGHAAGDVCIQRVAQTIEQALRHDEDAVFRYGGEEFLIVFKHVTPDLAVTLAERIRHAVEALAIPNPGIQSAESRGSVVTLSIGAAFGREGVGPERVLKWADDALYDAKHAGRNTVMLSKAGSVDTPSIVPTEIQAHNGIDATR